MTELARDYPRVIDVGAFLELQVRERLAAGERIVDTRGVFVSAAGPYVSPSCVGCPGPFLDRLKAELGLVEFVGPVGLPAWGLRGVE